MSETEKQLKRIADELEKLRKIEESKVMSPLFDNPLPRYQPATFRPSTTPGYRDDNLPAFKVTC